MVFKWNLIISDMMIKVYRVYDKKYVYVMIGRRGLKLE